VERLWHLADPEPKPEFIDPHLAAAVARLGATIAANPKKHAPELPPPAKVYQLPLWPEPVRGAVIAFAALLKHLPQAADEQPDPPRRRQKEEETGRGGFRLAARTILNRVARDAAVPFDALTDDQSPCDMPCAERSWTTTNTSILSFFSDCCGWSSTRQEVGGPQFLHLYGGG
jgi:hypothetical protein